MSLNWGWALILAGLVASLSQSSIGIGGGLLVMPLLSWWFPPQEVVVYSIPMFFTSTLVNFWRYRRSVRWRQAGAAVPGIMAGAVVGSELLRVESAGVLRAIIAMVALLFTGYEVSRMLKKHPLLSLGRWGMLSVSLISGVASAMTNIGGTILSFALMGQDLDPALFVGTLNALMLAMSVMKIVLFSGLGLLTIHRWAIALPSVPAIIAGSWMGQRLNRRLSGELFRWILVGVISVSAGVLLIVPVMR